MFSNAFSDTYHYLHPLEYIEILKCFCLLLLAYCSFRLCRYAYNIASSPSGIHYVNLKRQSLQMIGSYNPFSFEADYASANYSGIKCVLKSEQPCYVQAFWGVPISCLFELLHGDWQSLRNAVKTQIPAEKFSSKCIYANDPFILPAGEEKSVQFKLPLHMNENAFAQEEKWMRKLYPFVVLMVMKENEEIIESSVVAMASAIHIPDNHLLLYPQLIGHFIKLSSGQVGQVKKVFLSSPASADDEGDRYDLCLACYHRPVSMVFLPCRHACLCSVCFALCEKCPVCRTASHYYFELPNIYGRENN